MTDLKNKILNEIKNGQVEKTSRWYFISKKYFFWFFSGVFVTLSSLSFSILLKNIFNDFGSWYLLSDWFEIFPLKLIILWIISLIIFIFLSYLNFRNTKKGFKYRISFVVLTALILSIIFGSILYKINFSNYLEEKIEKNIKIYAEIKENQKKKIIEKLMAENIDPEKFFQNQEIIKITEKFKKRDEERIKKIKEILNRIKDKKDKEEIKEILNKIKNKKEDLNQKRIDYLIKKYQINNK